MLQSLPRLEIVHRALYIHDIWLYQIYSAIFQLEHKPDLIFCWLLKIFWSFPVVQPKLGGFSSNNNHRQLLCTITTHPKISKGASLRRKGSIFKISNTYDLSNPANMIVGYSIGWDKAKITVSTYKHKHLTGTGMVRWQWPSVAGELSWVELSWVELSWVELRLTTAHHKLHQVHTRCQE